MALLSGRPSVAMSAVAGYTLLAAGPALAALNESAGSGPLSSPPRVVLLDDVANLAAACNQQVSHHAYEKPKPLQSASLG